MKSGVYRNQQVKSDQGKRKFRRIANPMVFLLSDSPMAHLLLLLKMKHINRIACKDHYPCAIARGRHRQRSQAGKSRHDRFREAGVILDTNIFYWKGDQQSYPFSTGTNGLGGKINRQHLPVKAEAKNYYLSSIFGENRLTVWINLVAGVLLTLLVGGALWWAIRFSSSQVWWPVPCWGSHQWSEQDNYRWPSVDSPKIRILDSGFGPGSNLHSR